MRLRGRLSFARSGAPCAATVAEVEAMWSDQDNKCGCCGATFASTRRTHMDHDHATGKLRSFLCHSCNLGIGGMRTPDNVLLLVQYWQTSCTIQPNVSGVQAADWVLKALLNARKYALKSGHAECSVDPQVIEVAWEQQAGRCALCSCLFKNDKDAKMDHDHVTGVFRGFLCTTCNLAEGHVKTVERAAMLYAYMLKHRG